MSGDENAGSQGGAQDDRVNPHADEYNQWRRAPVNSNDFLEQLDDLLGADLWIDYTSFYKAGVSMQAPLSKDMGLERGLSGLRLSAEGSSST